MSPKILVIGSTGRVGSELAKLLLEKGNVVRAATRNPSKIVSLFHNQVEITAFDYENVNTFAPALNGIDSIFLIVRPGDNQSDKYAQPLIDEALKLNVKHIVDLTAMGVEQDETFMLRKLEKYIEGSGIAYTHLRPNWFMQNFNSGAILSDIKNTSAIHLPADDAKVSFIDVHDIAAVGSEILNDEQHRGKAYTLTGKEALSYYDVADKIFRGTGRKISYIPISEETLQDEMNKKGLPIDFIERQKGFYRRIRGGFCSAVYSDVEMILKRSPTSFESYVKENITCWI